jgi:hypothetical protein
MEDSVAKIKSGFRIGTKEEHDALLDALLHEIALYVAPGGVCHLCRGSERGEDDMRVGCLQHSHRISVLKALYRRLKGGAL